MHIHYNDNSHALTQSPVPIVMKTFLGNYCFKLNLSDPSPSVDEKGEEILHVHYMTTPKHKNP